MLTPLYDTSALLSMATIAALLLMNGIALYVLLLGRRIAHRSLATASLVQEPQSREYVQHGAKHFYCRSQSLQVKSSPVSISPTKATSSCGDDLQHRDMSDLYFANGTGLVGQQLRPTHHQEVQDHSGTVVGYIVENGDVISSTTFE